MNCNALHQTNNVSQCLGMKFLDFSTSSYWKQYYVPHLHELDLSVDCTPNTYAESLDDVLDLSGRCVKLNVPSRLEYLHFSIEIHPIETFLIYGHEISEDRVHTRAFQPPSGSIEERVRGASFTCTESPTRNFIAQGMFTMVYKTITDSPQEEHIKQIFSIALECKALYTTLCTICNQAVSTRKKNIIEV